MERGDGITERINYFTAQRNPVVLNAFTMHGAAGELNELLEEQLEALANYTERGSGWLMSRKYRQLTFVSQGLSCWEGVRTCLFQSSYRVRRQW